MMEKTYRVGARAAASTIIRDGESVSVDYVLDGKKITLSFRTRYHNLGYSVPVPGQIWLDANGPGEDVEEVAMKFTNGGRTIAAVISVATNAAINDLEPEVAFETTDGKTEREFLQRYMAPDDIALTSRFVHVDATSALIKAVGRHVERDRLVRAISHYSHALNSWTMGSELLVIVSLFMGIEAIKVAAWRNEAGKLGIIGDELAKTWGFVPDGRLTIDSFLEREARLRIVFAGNQALHKKAKEVSDAFEHGFSNTGALYAPAGQSIVPTAECLRRTIIKIANIGPDHENLLLGPMFSEPRGPFGYEAYLHGTLVGAGQTLAAEGTPYPMLHWSSELEDVTFDPATDKYSFRPRQNFTVNVAPGISLRVGTTRMRNRSRFLPGADWSGAA